MDSSVYIEIWRIVRYIIARLVGRIAFFVAIVLVSDKDSFVATLVATSLIYYVLDFIVQKFWTFRNQHMHALELVRQIGLYLLMRGCFLVITIQAYGVLTQSLGVNWVVAGALAGITTSVFRFLICRWIFIGSLQDLALITRKVCVELNAKLRSRTRSP